MADPDLVCPQHAAPIANYDDDLIVPASSARPKKRGRTKLQNTTSGEFLAAVLCMVGCGRPIPFGSNKPSSYLDSAVFQGIARCSWKIGGCSEKGRGAIGLQYHIQEFMPCIKEDCRAGWGLMGKTKIEECSLGLSRKMLTCNMSCLDYVESRGAATLAHLFLSEAEMSELQVGVVDNGRSEAYLLRDVVLPPGRDVREVLVRGSPQKTLVASLRETLLEEPEIDDHIAKKPKPLDSKFITELPESVKRKYDDKFMAGFDNTGDRSLSRLKRKFDPCRLVNALSYSRHLRNQLNFSDSLQDAQDYERDVNAAESGDETRDSVRDPTERTLHRTRGRLDPVCMALDRREFAAYKAEDSIAAICLHSDGSPVTGLELQGMVMDMIFHEEFNRPMVRRTLPGSALPYGRTDWVAKTFALVWAIWLVVGSDLATLNYFFDSVVSVTTDYGVEISSALICNFLPAFIQWIYKGGPAGKVDISSVSSLIDSKVRLMRNALRIGGWNHSLSHVMEAACKSFKKWPTWFYTATLILLDLSLYTYVYNTDIYVHIYIYVYMYMYFHIHIPIWISLYMHRLYRYTER